MQSNLTAHASTLIDAPLKDVWTALVNPDAIRQYMSGANVTSDWKEGSPITWKGEWQGKPYEDKGVILRQDPGRTLSYSHWSALSGVADTPENRHTVTIELSGEGGKTHVSLDQDNNKTPQEREESQKNWVLMLEGMKKVVEAG